MPLFKKREKSKSKTDFSLLNGYWEEGYHYYIEIRDGRFILRDAGKRVTFETDVEFDPEAAAAGERADLKIGRTSIADTYKGEPMLYITDIYYEAGEIHLLTYFTITKRAEHYLLKKVDHDPFYNTIILDDEYLDRLSGVWVEWSRNKDSKLELRIKGNDAFIFYDGHEIFRDRIHVAAYRSNPERILIVNYDLTVDGVANYSEMIVHPDMLTCYEQVCDMEMPMTVFTRREMLDKIVVPAAALSEPRNTMCICDEE